MRSCQAPPFWKFGWRLTFPPPLCRKWGRGGCILCFSLAWSESQLKKNMYTPTLSHFMLLAACLSYGVFYYFIVGRGVLTPRPPPPYFMKTSPILPTPIFQCLLPWNISSFFTINNFSKPKLAKTFCIFLKWSLQSTQY